MLQGERSMANDNRTIGRFQLAEIPPAPRGVPQIEVTFDIDANGIIQVSAKDKATGKEQNIRIEASSGLSEEEVTRMKQEAEANAEADKEAKERIEVLNQADALVFQTEKQLKEFGDKISEGNRGPDAALEELKKAHGEQDVDGCKAGIEKAQQRIPSGQPRDVRSPARGGCCRQPRRAVPLTLAMQTRITDVDFEEVK